MEKIKYNYSNLPISGGGYVTGLEFGKKTNQLYARTDIGGVYKFDRIKGRWRCLMEGVGADDPGLTYPLAIALDEEKGELLIAAGHRGEIAGIFAKTDNDGESFSTVKLPASVHGNNPGRGSGKRIAIVGDTYWFASQSEGLLKSSDEGKTWCKTNCPETNTTFVFANEDVLVVGCSGVFGATDDNLKRGNPLYYSLDAGATFDRLDAPTYPDGQPGIQGYVAYRYAWDGSYLYITMFGTGEEPGYFGLNAYGTDSVHNMICGRVLRYRFENGSYLGYEDITPREDVFDIINRRQIKLNRNSYPLAFGGIDVSVGRPGLMVLGLTAGIFGCGILRSFDYGNNWEFVMYELSIGEFMPTTPYMMPRNNDGHNCAHWLNDLKINPHDEDEVWYVTGTGTFSTSNFTDKIVRWTDNCDGLEETVHMNVYSLPFNKESDDDIYVVDAVGDIGAFIFRNKNNKCDTQVRNEEGHSYITVLNADYAENSPNSIVMTPRGNWRGSSKGGVIFSNDEGKSFSRLNPPYGFDYVTDELINRIEKPNVNSGWCAISSDARTIVWGLCEGQQLPADAVFVTEDMGRTWIKSEIETLDYERAHINERDNRPDNIPLWMKWPPRNPNQIKIFSDRVDPELFFGFGDNFRIYVSTDRAKHFRELEVSRDVPCFPLAIAEAPIGQIRGQTKTGSFIIAAGKEGLWHMQYDKHNDSINLERITTVKIADTVGFGASRDGKGQDTIYISGVVDNEIGFFRSEDFGQSWVSISDDKQRFGHIRSIDGDYRTFGRFFIASGTMGILCGEEDMTK